VNQILGFLVHYMAYLWTNARFRIVSGEASESVGDAILVVESAVLRLTFVNDRGDLFLDLAPTCVGDGKEGVGFDLVQRMLLGERQKSGILDESFAWFLDRYLDEIESRFSAENWPATREELKKLQAIRSKEMWG
jgi:hypothetical protein